MKMNDDRYRILIAVTETSPLSELWSAAVERHSETQGDLVAVFVSDDRWHRAASLPFTREISRVGAISEDFTAARADQVAREAADRARQRIEQLAAEAQLELSFEEISESEPRRIERLIGGTKSVLILPANIRNRPVYAVLQRLECHIVLIETTETENESQ